MIKAEVRHTPENLTVDVRLFRRNGVVRGNSAGDLTSAGHVDRIDLGVAADNARAIACYRQQGFVHVGSWPNAIPTVSGTIDVYWMTLTRAACPIIRPAAADVP